MYVTRPYSAVLAVWGDLPPSPVGNTSIRIVPVEYIFFLKRREEEGERERCLKRQTVDTVASFYLHAVLI